MKMRIAAILMSVTLIAWGAPGGMADAQDSIDDREAVEQPMDELVMELVEEHNDGEIPETVEMRVNGDEWQEIPFETAVDSLLMHEEQNVELPLSSHPADVGAASGEVPTECHPAIIHNVIAFGSTAQIEIANTGGDALEGTPDCSVFGAQTFDGAAEVTIQAPSGAATGSVANAAPGFAVSGASTSLGWGTANGVTSDCVLVVEINFFGIYIGQVGTGMLGCGSLDGVSAGAVLGPGA